MHYLTVLITVLLAITKLLSAPQDELDNLTDSQHTRVVWLQGSTSRFEGGTLKGFDSETGQEHQIAPSDGSYQHPWLCGGGHQVVISKGGSVYRISFDGSSGFQYITGGEATDVWKEPSTGIEWVIVKETTNGPISRFNLDNPSEKVTLYTAKVDGSDYQVSADGQIAAAFLPWPDCYVIINGAYQSNTPQKISNGCWSSVAQDDSHYWFHLLCCPHKNIKIFQDDTYLATIDLNPPQPAGTDTNEFYHPKFASKGARFMTLTAGYHGNASSNDAEVYVGKFADNCRSFIGWARITYNNGIPDYNPDAWIGVETLGPPELTNVILSPSSATIRQGESIDLTISTTDQHGDPFESSGNVSWSVSGGGVMTNTGNSGATFVSDGTAGRFTVTAEVDGVSGRAEIAVIDPSAINIRVNCGGGDVIDGPITWEGGAGYVSGGADYSFGGTHDARGVSEPAPNEVYQTVRHQDHSYSFPDIPDGTYLVRIHFTDATSGTDRAMDYEIEGELVLDNFNIVSAAGGSNKVVVREFPVTVSDGNGLQIQCRKDQGNDVFEAAIEIRSAEAQHKDWIEVSAPNGGQHFVVGDVMTIHWDASEGVEGVTIQISPDDGITWEYITATAGVSRTEPQWGAFEWEVTESCGDLDLISTNVRIKVAAYFDGAINDVSDATFAIWRTPEDIAVLPQSKSAVRAGKLPQPLAEALRRTKSPLCLIDAQGRIVRQWPYEAAVAGMPRLDGVPAGVYILRVGMSGVMLYIDKQ